MSREAMKQALEALESDPISHAGLVSRKQAITALRQALETEQEPVAWMYVNEDGECEQIEYGPVFDDPGVTPLYTSPPKREWVGLTDEEIYDCEEEAGVPQYEISSADLYAFAQAIEAKLKEKNKW